MCVYIYTLFASLTSFYLLSLMKHEILDTFLLSQTALQDCVSFDEFRAFVAAEESRKTKKSKRAGRKEKQSDEEEELAAVTKLVYKEMTSQDRQRRRLVSETVSGLAIDDGSTANTDTTNTDTLTLVADALVAALDDRTRDLQHTTSSLLSQTEQLLASLDDAVAALQHKARQGQRREGVRADSANTTAGGKRLAAQAVAGVAELGAELDQVLVKRKKTGTEKGGLV